MFMISIVFGSASPSTSTFLFKEEDKAKLAYANIQRELGVPGRKAEIIDDFGLSASWPGYIIQNVTLEDLEKSRIGKVERAMEDIYFKIDGNDRVKVDPKVKAASMTQGMPTIIHPSGRG